MVQIEPNRRRYVACIPARASSTRFPNKVMADLAGKPLVMHVYERVSQWVSQCYILVDDADNAKILLRYTDRVLMTSTQCRNGTERCAEAAHHLDLAENDIVINIQADEPLVTQSHVQAVLAPFADDSRLKEEPTSLQVGTVVYALNPDDLESPHRVKALVDANDHCLGFYRQVPPYVLETHRLYVHGGFYTYPVALLRHYVRWPQDGYEKTEQLEQVRFMMQGIPVVGTICATRSQSVDTPQDLELVRRMLLSEKGVCGER